MSSALPSTTAFAFNREDYINHVWDYVFGAIGEYLKAEIAKVNGFDAPVFGWENEVERLIDHTLPGWIEEAGTKGNFNRSGAIETAIQKVEEKVQRKWTAAINTVANHMKRRVSDPDLVLLVLPDQRMAEAAFFERVRENCRVALGPNSPIIEDQVKVVGFENTIGRARRVMAAAFVLKNQQNMTYEERITALQGRLEPDDQQLVKDLVAALATSIGLQNHYGALLNMYDGGQRLKFSDPYDWMARLAETGTLPVE